MNNQDEVVAAVVFKAVKNIDNGCIGCIFIDTDCDNPERHKTFPCGSRERTDGIPVIWTIKSA